MSAFISEKIMESHLSRKAIIYIRQSSERQVQMNIESQHIQYQLAKRAVELGWNQSDIIDDDLGRSAGYDSERLGFQKLVAKVGLGDVGIVISLEATRLARNNRDWYQLIDLCTIFDTIIGDHSTIYDPKDPNDRLLLGMKGTMSEAELNLIKFRMRQGRLSKAKRGALYSTLPPGYCLNENTVVEKSANIREQQAIELIFDKFEQLRSARQTYLWFVEEGISVPVNCKQDITDAKRRWQLPNYNFILQLLRNPFYAGAYAYGRKESRVTFVDGKIKKTNGHIRPMDQWDVLLKDHHEGYISWDQYEKNLMLIKSNQHNSKGSEAVGAIRNGKGLLVGLVRCRRCGRKMNVRYWGKSGTNARYVCLGEFKTGGNYCQSFSGQKTDRVFEDELFKVIKPAAIQAGISACEVMTQEYEAKIKYLEKELINAQYEVDRAFLQYNQVDPLNRLVAAELERRWNEKLQDYNELKERISNEQKKVPKPSSEDLEAVRSLSHRLPEIWAHSETDPVAKKKIIRMLVEEIIVDLNDETLIITMTIHWKGGLHTQVKFKKPVNGDPPKNKTNENIVELLKKLSPHYPDEEIARIFNCHKFKTGAGNPWNRTRVRGLRVNNKIAPFDRKAKKNVVSLNEASKKLGVNTYVLRQLIGKGLIQAKQIIPYAPFIINISEFEKKSVEEAVKRLKNGGSVKNIESMHDKQRKLF